MTYQTDLILKKGKTYTISAYVKGSGTYYIYCNRTDNVGEGISINGGNTISSEWTKITIVYTPSVDVYKVRFEMVDGSSLYISCFQIEYGAQATDYEPYHGETITVTNETESPAFGLKSHKGLTYIISPANVKCVYPTNESGVSVLEKERQLNDNKSDAVFDKSTGKKVVFTIENGIICAREV